MKKMKVIILLINVLPLLLVVGCTAAPPDDIATQPDNATERGDDNMNETKIQTMIDGLLSGELTDEEFIILFEDLTGEEGRQLYEDLRIQLGDEEYNRLLDRLIGDPPPLTDEQLEAQRIRMEEHRRTNVAYVISGNFTPAADNIDLQTIERLVFIYSVDVLGYSFVLDRMYGRVYYNPETSFFDMLEFLPYSAEFKEDDLTRFIQVIEESGLRDWEEYYDGIIDEYAVGGGRGWMIGMLFSDGTMLRRGGGGMFWTDVASSPDQFAILTDFIKTIGAEVQLRHNAETDSGN